MNKKELKQELAELIKKALEEWAESKTDMNSYGHGYDTGYLNALKEVEKLIAGLVVCNKCMNG